MHANSQVTGGKCDKHNHNIYLPSLQLNYIVTYTYIYFIYSNPLLLFLLLLSTVTSPVAISPSSFILTMTEKKIPIPSDISPEYHPHIHQFVSKFTERTPSMHVSVTAYTSLSTNSSPAVVDHVAAVNFVLDREKVMVMRHDTNSIHTFYYTAGWTRHEWNVDPTTGESLLAEHPNGIQKLSTPFSSIRWTDHLAVSAEQPFCSSSTTAESTHFHIPIFCEHKSPAVSTHSHSAIPTPSSTSSSRTRSSSSSSPSSSPSTPASTSSGAARSHSNSFSRSHSSSSREVIVIEEDNEPMNTSCSVPTLPVAFSPSLSTFPHHPQHSGGDLLNSSSESKENLCTTHSFTEPNVLNLHPQFLILFVQCGMYMFLCNVSFTCTGLVQNMKF